MKRRYLLLKNKIFVGDTDDIFKIIKSNIRKKNIFICPIATFALVNAVINNKIKKILDNFLLIPDSEWVCKTLKYLYKEKNIPKMRGIDLIPKILHVAQKEQYKIFLYGTTETTLKKLEEKLVYLFPHIKIVGIQPSFFRPLKIKEKLNLIAYVKKTKPDILLVSMGSPLQEVFSYDFIYKKPNYKESIIIITAGSAFDIISGVKSQAPEWMQNNGLEWLFRLIYEPSRLWKRYLVYGPIYILLVFHQKISMIFKSLTND